ncbi:AAA family ATPase [Micromonospora arborensis]|uniref:ATP-dependent nuclease n=1 Tax=Micromonospora TaxID=1873 RepID=UPI003400A9EF
MQFTVLPVRGQPPAGARGAFLERDNWDDYSFRTTFRLHYADENGARYVGQVKIARFGMQELETTSLEDRFQVLGENFFSLGQDDSYYEQLQLLGDDAREAILEALRDVAYDLILFQRAWHEQAMQTSLLRAVDETTVRGQYHRIATGGQVQVEYQFTYQSPGMALPFEVKPGSRPPTNIHALIGANGVGKTRLLNSLTHLIVDEAPEDEGSGLLTLMATSDGTFFANVISISFSAFDSITPVQASGPIKHTYVTLNTEVAPATRGLGADFVVTASSLTGARRRRWLRALATLETDPLFRDIHTSITGDSPGDGSAAAVVFDNLSSGHKIVLLAVTRLAELVTERTLVLIDEPETHLHPPLLAAFIRALSDLLINRNGVAIIATHSPVVLQETPRSCVSILRRFGNATQALRPEIETFGENVGTLTREVFGLEVTRSGFHRELSEAVADGRSYEEVVRDFGGQLGGEAKAIVRALVAVRDREGRQ